MALALALIAAKMQSDKAVKDADNARTGGNKSGAGDAAKAENQTSIESINLALEGMKTKEDPLDLPVTTVAQNSQRSDAAEDADTRRKKKEEQMAMRMAENPRGTGFGAGGKSTMGGRAQMQAAIKKQKSTSASSRLSLGSLK